MTEPGPNGEDERPLKPLMRPTFWIMLVLSVVCMLAGAFVAMLLPRLLAA